MFGILIMGIYTLWKCAVFLDKKEHKDEGINAIAFWIYKGFMGAIVGLAGVLLV